jgi:hypothetical protein
MSYNDFNMGHDWMPTDLWVRDEINNRIEVRVFDG